MKDKCYKCGRDYILVCEDVEHKVEICENEICKTKRITNKKVDNPWDLFWGIFNIKI